MALVETTTAALVAGLVTGAHCAGMCGPLVCSFLPAPAPAYHGGRMFSYTCLGALAGGLGQPIISQLPRPLMLLPWALALMLLTVAIGWKPALPHWPLIWKIQAKARKAVQSRPIWQKGFVLGALTPLLPCGPLYLLIGSGFVSGSAVKGGELGLAFSLGTVPLLWLAHGAAGKLWHYLSPARLRQFQRVIALMAAVTLAWRLRGTLHPHDSQMAAPGCGCSIPAVSSATSP